MNKHTLSHEEMASLATTQLEEASGGLSFQPDSLLNGIRLPGSPDSFGGFVDQSGLPYGIVRGPNGNPL
jgi:hypothetical protein